MKEYQKKSSDNSANHIISLMKIIYFMAKKNHSMKNFHDFVDLAYELNVPDLQQGPIAYNNEKSGKELLEAISKTIEYDIWEEISKSPCISVIIDESNDISTTKNLIVYVSYIYQGITKTRFLKICSLLNGDATSITNILVDLFKKKGWEFL